MKVNGLTIMPKERAFSIGKMADIMKVLFFYLGEYKNDKKNGYGVYTWPD